jgi:hypothetical protein
VYTIDHSHRTTVATLRATFIPYTGGGGLSKPKAQHAVELRMRHAIEGRSKAVQTVQDYERRLEITERWTPGTREWVVAQEMASLRRYRKCLDELEALIVSRMFELTKINMARTGTPLEHPLTADSPRL